MPVSRLQLLIKPIRIDVVPGLSYLYRPERFRFEDQDVEEQMLIGVVYREIPPPLRKSFRLGNRCFRFLSPCHGTVTSQFCKFFDRRMCFSIGGSYSIESLVVGEHITGNARPTGMFLHCGHSVQAIPPRLPDRNRMPAHRVSGQGAVSRQEYPRLQ